MKALVAFAWGGLFGAGLAISGMTDPTKVRGFLDFTGAWDPTLLFVMASALIAFAGLRPLIVRRRRHLFPQLATMSSTRLDARLIVGSLLFGVGWGIAGFCPGPAVVAAGGGSSRALVVFAALMIGLKLAEFTSPRTITVEEPVALDGCS